MLVVNFLLLGAVLFSIGVFGVLARRNAVMVLMSVELILNAVNLNFIAFALMHGNVDGQVFALYVIAVAAAEVGVGLGDGAARVPQPSFDRPRRAQRDEGLDGVVAAISAGWFLENAWLIPVIPGVAFFVIILFGKRLPMTAAEVGLASMAARCSSPRHGLPVDPAHRPRRAARSRPVRSAWRSGSPAASPPASAEVTPSRSSHRSSEVVDVVAERRHRVHHRPAHRRPGGDDAAASSRSSRCSCRSSRSSTCAATVATPTSSPPSRCSPPACSSWSSPRTWSS